MPTNQLRHPTWFLDGEEPEDISTTMAEIPQFLLDFCESFFIGCIESTIVQSAWPPIGIAPIDPVKAECPTLSLMLAGCSCPFRLKDDHDGELAHRNNAPWVVFGFIILAGAVDSRIRLSASVSWEERTTRGARDPCARKPDRDFTSAVAPTSCHEKRTAMTPRMISSAVFCLVVAISDGDTLKARCGEQGGYQQVTASGDRRAGERTALWPAGRRAAGLLPHAVSLSSLSSGMTTTSTGGFPTATSSALAGTMPNPKRT
jgi:hypothetical protein